VSRSRSGAGAIIIDKSGGARGAVATSRGGEKKSEAGYGVRASVTGWGSRARGLEGGGAGREETRELEKCGPSV
jgi:hypothetical protein